MNIFAVYLVEEGALKLVKVGAVYSSEEGSLSSEGMCCLLCGGRFSFYVVKVSAVCSVEECAL